MKIIVFLAGVLDPKWPVTPEIATGHGNSPEHRIMSPFDEAALEMALRVRDARPQAHIAVRIGGGAAGTKIARTVAALNIGDVGTVALDRPWDQAAMARGLAPTAEGADLILMGREFGDFDDGLLPALLAGLLEVPFFGRAQTIEASEAVLVMRETRICRETLVLDGTALVSATNDRRTRLRKPLMKNVMQARQAAIGETVAEPSATAALAFKSLLPLGSGRAKTDCEMLPGSPEAQARALAVRLWEARA